MKPVVPKNSRNFLTCLAVVSFLRRTLLRGVDYIRSPLLPYYEYYKVNADISRGWCTFHNWLQLSKCWFLLNSWMVHSDFVGTPIFVSFPPVRLMMAPRSIASLNGMIYNNPDIFIEMHSLILFLPNSLLILYLSCNVCRCSLVISQPLSYILSSCLADVIRAAASLYPSSTQTTLTRPWVTNHSRVSVPKQLSKCR